MSYIGQMVRVGGSAAMKVINITNGIAECWWIDGSGSVRTRFHDVSQLTPMWMSLGPKSLWPEVTQLDLIEIEKEEQAAVEDRKARKKAAVKSKRSNKAKRGKAA